MVWASGWLRDESFYRDIAAEMLAVGAVALIAYTYAVSAGYVSTPSGRTVLAMALHFFALVITVFTYVAFYRGQILRAFVLSIPALILMGAGLLIVERVQPGFVDAAIELAPRIWWVWAITVPIATFVGVRGWNVRRKRLRKATATKA